MKKTALEKKKLLLLALEKTLGVVTSACKKVKVSRMQFYRYYNGDEKFRIEVDEISEVALDFAETQLYKQIEQGNATSTIFYLKTKGKKRGYIERVDLTNSDKTLKSEPTIIVQSIESKATLDKALNRAKSE